MIGSHRIYWERQTNHLWNREHGKDKRNRKNIKIKSEKKTKQNKRSYLKPWENERQEMNKNFREKKRECCGRKWKTKIKNKCSSVLKQKAKTIGYILYYIISFKSYINYINHIFI